MHFVIGRYALSANSPALVMVDIFAVVINYVNEPGMLDQHNFVHL